MQIALPLLKEVPASVLLGELGKGLDDLAETEIEAGRDDFLTVLMEYSFSRMSHRSRTHLPDLLYLLRKAGIGYRAVEIDRLTDLPEIIDILALTRAIVHLGDRQAWLAILRSPWAGLDWTDLHTLVRNDTKRTIWELLHDEATIGRLSEFGLSSAEASLLGR